MVGAAEALGVEVSVASAVGGASTLIVRHEVVVVVVMVAAAVVVVTVEVAVEGATCWDIDAPDYHPHNRPNHFLHQSRPAH